MTIETDAADGFLRLRRAVLDRRPILQEILQRDGQKKLYDYAQGYRATNPSPQVAPRRAELIQTVRTEVAHRLGPVVADQVAAQLAKYYFASTADHHGPVTHPWFVNSNLLITAPLAEHADSTLQSVLAFGCANVSLNNPSFPRGLLFHTCRNGRVQQHRLSFLPSTAHSCSIYGFRAYTAREIKKVRTLLREKTRCGEVPRAVASTVDQVLTDIYDRPEILACPTYAEQVTKTNFALWKTFFPAGATPPPDLVYLEQETLVAQLLTDFHLDRDTTIHRLLFNPAHEALLAKYFDGLPYAFSTSEQRGTYLFWGLSPTKHDRVQLWKRGSWLVSADGAFRLELTPGALAAALQQQQIVPSVMLIFTVLAFYYGLKCLGGFSQVNYLTFMQRAYYRLQREAGNGREAEICQAAETKATVDVTVAFLGTPSGNLLPATGLDLLLYGDQHRWQRLVEELKVMTLEDALNPGMPDFYRIIYPGAEGDRSLLRLTPAEIATLTKLDKKIRPCVHLPDHRS